jgi:hypothetical protein
MDMSIGIGGLGGGSSRVQNHLEVMLVPDIFSQALGRTFRCVWMWQVSRIETVVKDVLKAASIRFIPPKPVKFDRRAVRSEEGWQPTKATHDVLYTLSYRKLFP